jgi:hypothetical protein
LPGPVRATYEAGPTGFVLARKLEAVGVDCLVYAPGLIPRGPSDRCSADAMLALGVVGALACEPGRTGYADAHSDQNDAASGDRLDG